FDATGRGNLLNVDGMGGNGQNGEKNGYCGADHSCTSFLPAVSAAGCCGFVVAGFASSPASFSAGSRQPVPSALLFRTCSAALLTSSAVTSARISGQSFTSSTVRPVARPCP